MRVCFIILSFLFILNHSEANIIYNGPANKAQIQANPERLFDIQATLESSNSNIQWKVILKKKISLTSKWKPFFSKKGTGNSINTSWDGLNQNDLPLESGTKIKLKIVFKTRHQTYKLKRKYLINTYPLPETPALTSLGFDPALDDFTIQWANQSINTTQQIQLDTSSSFDSENLVEFTTTDDELTITPTVAGTYYLRMRSLWNQDSETLGNDSDWTTTINFKILSDDEFLDLISEKTFNYFIDQTNDIGLTADSYNINVTYDSFVASTAASGFYLSALPIGVERGWISLNDATQKALTTLNTFKNTVANQNGYFYHFLQEDGSATTNSEVSSIDTALLLAGALTAGEYFGGSVQSIAHQIFNSVDWDWMLDTNVNIMHQKWTVANGLEHYYNAYSEHILLNLLSIGANTNATPWETFYTYRRPKDSFQGDLLIHTSGGQLFTYLFPLAWFKLQNTTDMLGTNWWTNAMDAITANQAYCLSESDSGYTSNLWGLSASDGPSGYTAYGAKPAYSQTDDGTITLNVIAGSLPFDTTHALNSLKYIYNQYHLNIWNTYGFLDAMNMNQNWFSSTYLGIDQGLLLLMIENYRTGLIWQYFMQNQFVLQALDRTHFSGFDLTPSNIVLDDFEDNNLNTPATSLAWNDGGDGDYALSNTGSPVYEGSLALNNAYNKTALYSFVNSSMDNGNSKRDFSNHELLTIRTYGNFQLLAKLKDHTNAESDIVTLTSRNASNWNKLIFDYSALN